MAKGLIVYTSQNGTTEDVAGHIAEGLASSGHVVDRVDLRERPSASGYDFLGVGSPACIFRPSYLALDFIGGLAPLAQLPFFTFVTYGTDIGDAANWLRRRLIAKGGAEVGHFRCRGKHLFPGYTHRGVLFCPSSPVPDEIAQAKHFGQEIGERLCRKAAVEAVPFDPPIHPILRLERLLTSRPVVRHVYSRFFAARKDRCKGCGTCVRSCPKGNIRLENGRHPAWGRQCVLCLACEVKCPRNAIRTPISWLVFAPFLRFNIRRAQRCGVPFSSITDRGAPRDT
jgi:flavodoxin/NAD-dependent dihydropyrimidine dehydrogenase PreA subunit